MLGPSRALPREVRAACGFAAAASAGLFVGIRGYQDASLHEVRYAVDDAIDLAWCFGPELDLIQPSKMTLALSGEAEKPSSRAALEQLLALGARRIEGTSAAIYRAIWEIGQLAGPQGLLVFTFSGHGLTDQGKHLLATHELVLRRPVSTSLDFPAVMADIARSKAERRLVVLDSCRDYFTQDRAFGAAGMSAEFFRSIATAKGAAILSGTVAGGSTYDDPNRQNGAFTAALLDELRGGRSSTGPCLTLGELAGALDVRMRAWVGTYRPHHMSKSLGVGTTFDPESMRSFPLAVDSGRLEEAISVAERYRTKHRPRRRWRLPLAAAAGLLLVGLGGLRFAGWPAPREPVQDPLVAVEPTPAGPTGEQVVTNPIAPAPNDGGSGGQDAQKPPVRPPEPSQKPVPKPVVQTWERTLKVSEIEPFQQVEELGVALRIVDFGGNLSFEVEISAPGRSAPFQLDYDRNQHQAVAFNTAEGRFEARFVRVDAATRQATLHLKKL
jgi:hypothetical protein